MTHTVDMNVCQRAEQLVHVQLQNKSVCMCVYVVCGCAMWVHMMTHGTNDLLPLP